MAYPRSFLSESNFLLAFSRLARSSNADYKKFHRHLLPSYQISLGENVRDLVAAVRRGSYRPSEPLIIYRPKANGLLRPISILCLNDLIVYQAIANAVAEQFRSEQDTFSLKRTFANILASPRSQFFFQPWRQTYAAYCGALSQSFDEGYSWLAEFDLVSLYELIDHRVLRACLAARFDNPELLNLLFDCLQAALHIK